MTNIIRISYTLISMLYFLKYIIVNNIVMGIPMDCPKFRLIQPLDPIMGVTYAIIAADKYFIITETEANSNADIIYPSGDMPDMFDKPNELSKYFYGAMLVDNRSCDPLDYYLFAYKYEELESGHINDWYTKFDFKYWSKQSKWTTPQRVLPNFLLNDPFMNTHHPKIMVYWPERRMVYVIQMPLKNAPINDFRKLYHAIVFSSDCSPNFTYLEDEHKNIKAVLYPYEEYDSCFILNTRQLYCIGHTGLFAYDIDLTKTMDGQLRVEGKRAAVAEIPVISKICKWWQQYSNIITNLPETTTTNTSTEQTVINGESKAAFWLLMITIFILLFGIILVIVFCCKREKQNRDVKEQLENIGSGVSMRSRINNLNSPKHKSSELDGTTSQISTRTAAVNKASKLAKNEKQLDAKSTITDVASMRSSIARNKQTQQTGRSNLGDDALMSNMTVRTTHK